MRPIAGGQYCLFGPMSTPHIKAHVTLEAGQSRDVAAELPAGDYRLRTLEPGPERTVAWEQGGFPEVIAGDDEILAGAPAPDRMLRLTNRSRRPLTLIVEERAWVKDASTNSAWWIQFIWPLKAEHLIAYVSPDYTQTIIARTKRDYVWIMARTPEIPESDFQALAAKVGDDVGIVALAEPGVVIDAGFAVKRELGRLPGGDGRAQCRGGGSRAGGGCTFFRA